MTIIPWQRLPNDQRGPSDSMSPESGLNSHSMDIIMFKTEHMAPESTEKSGVRSMEGRSRRRSGVKRRSQPTSPSSTDRPQYPRTRTGCLTCRRRKKKCDESKPSCYNCIKNNYFCEGYETKRPWRKRGRSSPSALSVVLPQLPQIIGAIETPIDSQLLSYFVLDASSVLNIYSEGKNPFEELVIDMAFNHAGLMHSLICLSASCMIARQASPPQEVVVRQRHHFDRGIVCLRQKIEGYNMGLSTTNNGDHTILQTILHCLEAVVSGENQGSYRYHLIAAQGLMNTHHNMTNEVQEFARQFLLYHNVANSISSVSPMSCTQDGEDPISTTFREETPQSLPESNPSFPTIASIMHGLTTPISQTRLLREEIRKNKTLAQSTHYATLDNLLPSYLNTDAQLRSWDSVFTPNTPHHWAALVYRQSAWAYLYRTVKPSTPSPELSQGVTGGMTYVKLILTDKTPKTRWLHGIMLPPLFLFGCAAFETTQREAITRALDTIFEYSRWGNISHIRRVLLGVWAYMDAGLEESWDWEEVMAEMGLDVMVS